MKPDSDSVKKSIRFTNLKTDSDSIKLAYFFFTFIDTLCMFYVHACLGLLSVHLVYLTFCAAI